MHLDKSILIHASPGEVFAWLAPHRMPSWNHGVVRATPLAEGRFEIVGRALGHRFEAQAEATLLEDSRAFAWRQVAGDYEEHRASFLLEPVGDGTRVHFVADVELPYVMPEVVTEAALRRELSRDADDALFRLKALVERHRAPAAS